ncbi:hypothetical protein F5Y16DRAFT_406442 [Xylariaceae sp. FL0255]|nr:hypothetical protein F5Y16DRAFT_406442 [Xylariaceae sp. FL0255]
MASFNKEFRVASSHEIRYITPSEVEEAVLLEQKGVQRLQSLSQSHPTSFYVSLPLPNGHMAATEITVSPDLQARAKNPPFEVNIRYVPCHTIQNIPIPEQSRWLRPHLQRIYNAFIVATRWTIHADEYERPRLGHDGSCHQSTQFGFDWLVGHQEIAESNSSDSDNTTSQPVDTAVGFYATGTTATQSQHTSPAPRKRPRVDTVESKGRNPRSQQTTVESIARRLAEKVKSGLSKVVTRREQSLEVRARIEALTTQCLAQKDDKRKLWEYVGQLEAELANRAKGGEREPTMDCWVDWLFSCCLSQMLVRMGDASRWRRANAATIIFGIVNKLLPIDGIDALGVLIGFAAHHHTLNDASLKGADDQDLISTLVAYELHGQLQPLPIECEIPYPAAWVSTVTQVSIKEVLTALKMNNLAFLAFPRDSATAGVETTYTTSLSMGQAKQMWSAFEHNVNSEAGRLPRSLGLLTGSDFDSIRQSLDLDGEHAADVTQSLRRCFTASASPQMLAIVDKEFSRLVNAWAEETARIEDCATLDNIRGASMHQQDSGFSTVSAVVSPTGNLTPPFASLSVMSPQRNTESSPLNMLLEAAHQANPTTARMPQLAPNLFSDTELYDTGLDTTDGQSFQCINPDVLRIANVVAPTAVYGGGLHGAI